jgi:hypothetical protein
MTGPLLAVAAAALLLATAGQQAPGAVKIGWLRSSAGAPGAEDGIAFGLEEAAQTLRLVGASLEVVERHVDSPAAARSAAEEMADLSVRAILAALDGEAVATVGSAAAARRIAFLPVPRPGDAAAGGPTTFHVRLAPGATVEGGTAVEWHGGLERFGAAQLNERFVRRFGRPMGASAWCGWAAVKAVLEAALRGPDVVERLTRLRFDAHKGVALRFDLADRRLVQPSYPETR